MLDCPRCHQPIDSRGITCPYCGCILKAHGHPGIPLHRATDQEYLCQSCRYDADDSCTFPQRPLAKECTLYRPQAQAVPSAANQRRWSVQQWFHRNLVWLVLLAMLVVSFLLAL